MRGDLFLTFFSKTTLDKKWGFPLRISSVDVTKSAVSCGFGHIYWKNLEWKTSFFVYCKTLISIVVLFFQLLVFLSTHVILVHEGLNFCYSFRIFFWWFGATVITFSNYILKIFQIIFWGLSSFLHLIQSGESMYDRPLLKVVM